MKTEMPLSALAKHGLVAAMLELERRERELRHVAELHCSSNEERVKRVAKADGIRAATTIVLDALGLERTRQDGG